LTIKLILCSYGSRKLYDIPTFYLTDLFIREEISNHILYFHHITNNSMQHNPSEKLIVAYVVKKFLAFYGT